MPHPREVTPTQLQALLLSIPKPVLLDVRQPAEHETGALPDSILIPLDELPARLDELDRCRQVVVYCHHGIRSLSGAAILINAGFENVVSLAGGVARWSEEVDPSFPRY